MLIRRRRNAMRVEHPRHLAGVAETHPNRRARELGRQTRAKQTLQIDHQIKPPSPQADDERDQLEQRTRIPPRLREAMAIEPNHLVKPRMTVQQTGEARS